LTASDWNAIIPKIPVTPAVHRSSRREFLTASLLGLGGLAHMNLLRAGDVEVMGESNASSPAPHFTPRARRVIYINLAGAPSNLELFDYKPLLATLDGKPCPEHFFKGKTFLTVSAASRPEILGPQAAFAQHGESGAWVSERLPFFSRVVDDVTFLKAVHTEEFNHGPAELMMLCGHARAGRPTFGAWTVFGLGSDNDTLPAYIVLGSGDHGGVLGKDSYGAGFLPASYQGVKLRPAGDPVLNLSNPRGMDDRARREAIATLARINQVSFEQYGDPEILARNAQYEMARRMQASVPDAVDIWSEPKHAHQLYGTTPGKASFANNCMLARRLIERGVRFVQLNDYQLWDHHGGSEIMSVRAGLIGCCRNIDQPMTALLIDLKQRGLLEDTLLVWAGEFGRTPVQQGKFAANLVGRDHNPYANTIWMAGAGLKPGVTYGETDEFGFLPGAGAVHVHDIHATLLHLLGFDHERLTFTFQGRPYRLTDVAGQVIRPILA
jgi:hypothetical protein